MGGARLNRVVVVVVPAVTLGCLTTNTVSPAFSVLGSAQIQALMQGYVAKNVGIDARIGDTLHSRVGNIAVDGDAATGTICYDYGAVTFADPNRTYTPAEAGFGQPKLERLTLTRAAPGRWTVQTSEVAGPC